MASRRPRMCRSSEVQSRLSETDSAIVWQVRAPRVVLGLLVGAMLSLRGRRLPGHVPEPARRPVPARRGRRRRPGRDARRSSTAGRPGGDLLPVAAFVGGAVGGRARLRRRPRGRAGRGPATFALAGVTVAAFLTAIQTFVQQQHADTLQAVYSWILGSLRHGRLARRAADPALRGRQRRRAAAAPARARCADPRRRGGREAGRGHRPRAAAVVVAATLGTAAAVAVSGLIGFLGIIVPHFVRLVAGGELPDRAAGLDDRRRRLPGPGRRGRPDRRRHPRSCRSAWSRRSSARRSSLRAAARGGASGRDGARPRGR